MAPTQNEKLINVWGTTGRLGHGPGLGKERGEVKVKVDMFLHPH